MIRRLRVTIEGRAYEVTVETDDEPGNPTSFAGGIPGSASPIPHTPSSPIVRPSPAPAPAPAVRTAVSRPGEIPSPLAGRVIAINVQAGQEVKEGDHLLTLEAMKMNTFVTAPSAGKVREVKVTVGAAVEEGQALLALE